MEAQRKAMPSCAAIARLCPQCGLCCNGALFKDVELQPGDDASMLQALGICFSTIRSKSQGSQGPQRAARKLKFPQPCAMFDHGLCRIYSNRPARCRDFECALLKSVEAGQIEPDVALRTIRATRQYADKVLRLLRELCDTDEALSLNLRFKRVKKRLERKRPDDETTETFSRLTLAMHDLNMFLRNSFYTTEPALARIIKKTTHLQRNTLLKTIVG